MTRRLRGGLASVVALLALVVWFGPYAHGRYIDGEIVDTPVYANYLTLIDHGQLPYRDFAVEYPPLAFAPWLAAWQGDEPELVYRHRFRTEIGLLVALTAATVTLTSLALRRNATRSAAAGITVALAPLAIGSVIAARYDLWPVTLTSLALVALATHRHATAALLIGLGAAAKLWPALVLPVTLVVAYRHHRLRRAIIGAAGGLAVGFAPGLLASPRGLWHAIATQAGRPLQIESLAATILIATRHLTGVALRVVTTSGSQNLAGSPVGAARLATVLTQLVVVAAILVISIRAVRASAAPTETAISAGGCVIAAVLGLSVVASPQFVVWLVPFAALLLASRDRLDTAASCLIVAAWLLTGVEFPHRYWSLALDLSPTTATLVAARSVALLGASALLVRRLVVTARRQPGQ